MDSEVATSHSGDRAKVSHTSSNAVPWEPSFAASESSPFSEWRVIRPERHFDEMPTNRQSDWRTLARLPGLIVVCFGRLWVRGRTQFLGTQAPAAKVRILGFKNLPLFRFCRCLQNHV